jgi:predicted deacetylase
MLWNLKRSYIMLRIRIDDVLVHSKGYNPDDRFAQISRWLEQCPRIKQDPTILVKDIQAYPTTVEAIRQKVQEGKMFPELHGWEHVDYNKLDDLEVARHLFKSMDWFEKTLHVTPKIWATPWGAESERLSKIASSFDLKVEGVGATIAPGQWLAEARKQKNMIMDQTVMDHWWQRGLRLLRIATVINCGSYEEAAKTRKDLWEA